MSDADMPRLLKFYPKPTYSPTIYSTTVVIDAANRITSEIMTKFEYTQIIATRAKQIEQGARCYTDVVGLDNPIAMAKKELRDHQCPLTVVRILYSRSVTASVSGEACMYVEHWAANEMGIHEYI